MWQKIFVGVLAFAGTFLIQWYGNFTGKLPAKGTYLGFAYDSIFARAIVTQFEYLWVLIIINIIFTSMFQLGFEAFKNNFLPLAIVWLAMGPISALVFNSFVLKEKVTWVAFVGVLAIIVGSILVIAQKEVLAFIKK